MAKMDFIEKDYFERLFGMSSGYVLDFSNRSFQEFVYSVMQIDIYAKYSGLSKAKILRTFSNGRTINIVLMTVQELAIALTRQIDLTDVLKFKVRALAEEGNYNKSILERDPTKFCVKKNKALPNRQDFSQERN